MNEWISVKERLPEDLCDVIIAVRTRNGLRWSACGRYEEDKDEWYNVYDELRTVTHWMPLPEPPKEEQCVN